MTGKEREEMNKAARIREEKVGVTAHEICLLLEERRFTFYGAEAVLRKVENELEKARDRQLVKAAEYATDRYGQKIEGSPFEADNPDYPG
jgi:hypothetical protein